MRVLPLVLFLLCVPACERKPATPSSIPAPPPASVSAAGIAWHQGDVEGALEQARTTATPVLLYWGTEWCPPCVALRATIFTRSDFVEASHAFVPIYLDGDRLGTEGWRDAFRLGEFPMLLLLRSDRAEITRLSAGLGPAEYASVLKAAERDERPIEDTLSLASSGPPEAAILDQDCRRLATHAWNLYTPGERKPTDLAVTLTAAAARCASGQPIAQARLSLYALGFALESESDALERGQAASTALSERVHALELLLRQPDVVGSSIDVLIGLDPALYTVVRRQGRAFTSRFHESWTDAMLEATRDMKYRPSHRLLALAAGIDAAKQLRSDHRVPNVLMQRAIEDVDAALQSTRDRYARADIVDAACNVYSALGEDIAAHELLERELANTATPYYYFSALADIAERQGRIDEAVTWLGRAYLTAREEGPATTIRWGDVYLRGLIRLAPDEVGRIRMATLGVIDALDATRDEDIRIDTQLTDLTHMLREWAVTPQRHRVLLEVEQRMHRAS